MTLAETPDIQDNPRWDAQAAFDSTDLGLFMGIGAGWSSGCAVTPTQPNSFAVNVAAGVVFVDGNEVVVSAASALAPSAPAVTDRKDLVLVGASGVPYIKAGTPCPVANWQQDSVFLPPVKPAPDANTVVLAELYVQGNVPPPGGPITPTEIVDKRTGPIPQVGWLDARYLAGLRDVLANIDPPTTPNWSTSESPQVDSSATFQAAFADALAAQVVSPTGRDSERRGRVGVEIPAGAYYVTSPLALMTQGGARTFGIKYRGAGPGMTEVYYQPSVGNPRLIGGCSIANGGTTLTDPGASFTSADVGHRVLVYGAGPGGAVTAGGALDTVILSVSSPTTAILAVAASAAVLSGYVEVSAEAPLLFNGDKWAFAEFEGIDFVGLQPTGSIPAVSIPSGSMGVLVTDGAMASGSAVLTSPTAGFTQDMIGATVTVAGAGAGGTTLTTTILGLNLYDVGANNGATSVTLAAANASGGSVAGATVSVLTNVVKLHRVVTDGAIVSGTNQLSSASASFTTADLGSWVGVPGAGAGGGFLLTTIQHVISATTVLLANNAGATVVGATTTLAGKTITGKHIGNTVTIAGAGPAGATLSATLGSIRCGDVNGVPTTQLVLTTTTALAACSVAVTGATVTIDQCANAVFWRSFSNGGVVGPVCRSVTWRGAWARVFHLDGTNQNADLAFYSCNLFDRPGTFLHITPDPANLTSAAADQQLEYDVVGGIWAPIYGDWMFFDMRGGNVQVFGGSYTIGSVAALTQDDGGTLPVPVVGGIFDPGGTWFRMRDRAPIRDKRALQATRMRFEERTVFSLIRDIEWSIGQVLFENCSDDSTHATGAGTVFSRIGLVHVSGITGATVVDKSCTWKGTHLVRYNSVGWRTQHVIAYESCHLVEQATALAFCLASPVGQSPTSFGTVSLPCVQFRGDCKNSNQLAGTTGFRDVVDCSLNWQRAAYSLFERRWAKFIDQSIPGIPSAGLTAQINLPFDVVVTQIRVHVPAVATGSNNSDWTLTIADASGTVLHTFQQGQDGVPVNQSWRGPIDAIFVVPFFLAQSLDPGAASPDQHRQLILTVGGTGTTNAPGGFVAVEYMG